VVPESPTAQGSPVEEQQQLKDHDIEDKANEEYPPPSDTKDEKMYQFSLAGFELCWSTWASPPPQVQDQGSPASRAGGVQSHHRNLLRIQSPLQTQGTSF
jgi:hypothetical protein